MRLVDESLTVWLKQRAQALNSSTDEGSLLVPRFGLAGLFRTAVPVEHGGAGGSQSAAIAVVAELAEHSVSAAFVFWAQRASIECILQASNKGLQHRLLPELVNGLIAGAPGLSNGMKSLRGIDTWRMQCTRTSGRARLDGSVPWATNLQPQGFVALVAANEPQAGCPAVFAVPHRAPGLVREPDLDLAALRGTSTGSLTLADVMLDDDWMLHYDVRVFLPQVRPMFIGLQCGLGLGLARASLHIVRQVLEGRSSILHEELASLETEVDEYWHALSTGIDSGAVRDRPRDLLVLRMRMVEIATSAVQLELQALGGSALLNAGGAGFWRRMQEAAFLGVVTPTLVQLKTELAVDVTGNLIVR